MLPIGKALGLLRFDAVFELFMHVRVVEVRFMQVRVKVDATLKRHKSGLDLRSDFPQSSVLVCTEDMSVCVQVRGPMHLVLSAATQCFHAAQDATNRTHVRAKQTLATIHRLIASRTIRAHANAYE